MITQEEIAEQILEKTLEVTEILGEEAGMLFLEGVNFGASLAMRLIRENNTLDELADYYLNITKGEIN
jgi:hypothetical protein